jgi:hypothetical protein
VRSPRLFKMSDLVHIYNNICPTCNKNNLTWNLKYSVSQMEMFKCGHGTCKKCYQKTCTNFTCPVCNKGPLLQSAELMTSKVEKIATFNDWYSQFAIYIENGIAQNIVKNTLFGQQLLRLIKEAKKVKKEKK